VVVAAQMHSANGVQAPKKLTKDKGPPLNSQGHPQGAKRGLVIKPLKCELLYPPSKRAACAAGDTAYYPLCAIPCAAKPGLPANFEEVTWAKLQDAVRAVYAKRPVSCSLEELYSVRGVQANCV
jgi:hypothetical protein